MSRVISARTPEFTAEEVARWADHMRVLRGWSDRECARRLGAGTNAMTHWRRHGAAGYIRLAAAALTHETPPWDDPGALAAQQAREEASAAEAQAEREREIIRRGA